MWKACHRDYALTAASRKLGRLADFGGRSFTTYFDDSPALPLRSVIAAR